MIKWAINLLNQPSISSEHYNWKKLPNVPITSIELYLPNKKTVILEGFERYLIISTNYQIVHGGSGKIFDTVNILGKKNNEVYQITFHRKGKLFQCKNKWAEWKPLVLNPLPQINKKKRYEIKYSQPLSTNPTDWHIGITLKTPKIYLKH